jgi:hypothetical protein
VAAQAGALLRFKSSINGYGNIYVHHIIWVFAHNGNWCWHPDYIDHIDGNHANNKISNFRIVSPSQSNMNRIMPSSSGHLGVHWHIYSRKWIVNIQVEGSLIHLGYYHNLDEAINVRRMAEDHYFG